MNTYMERKNVAEWLNNKLDSGLKQKQGGPENEKIHPMKNLTGRPFPGKTSIWSSLKMNVCLQITCWQGSCQFCSLSYTDKILETDSLAFIFPRPLFPFQPSNSCCLCSWVWYVNPIRDFSFLDSYTTYGKHAHLI